MASSCFLPAVVAVPSEPEEMAGVTEENTMPVVSDTTEQVSEIPRMPGEYWKTRMMK